MILAAGRGERLRPLTDRVPKPLIEIGGECMIDRHLRSLAAAGVRRVVINVAWLGPQIVDHVAGGKRFGLRVSFSDEGDEALETAGGIVEALPLLGDQPFWIVNADVFTEFGFDAPRLDAADMGHLYLTDNPPHHRHGDFCLVKGRVAAPGTGPSTLTYAGIAVFRPAFFAGLERGRGALGPLLHDAAARGTLAGSSLPGQWHDIGSPERLEHCRREVSGLR